MDPESSLDLIARAQSGDRAALERLLARYWPRLRRWASGRLPHYARQNHDTEDLVQEALIGVVKKFGQIECHAEWALQRYLRRAVTNHIIDEVRRVAAQPPHGPLPESAASRDASPLARAIGQELFSAYDHGLSLLTEMEQEAVIARLELGCSWLEIAQLLEKPSEDAARVFVARALKKLAQSMPRGLARKSLD